MQTSYILFAEDDADDQDMIRECCSQLRFEEQVRFVDSGEDVFRFLDKIADAKQYPSLIVLDINMPRMNGSETLLRLKRHTKYKTIPVVIYSTSSRNPEQYLESSGANAFFKKPSDFSKFKECIQRFIDMVNPPASPVIS